MDDHNDDPDQDRKSFSTENPVPGAPIAKGFDIRVHDPETQGSGYSSFTVYKVTSRCYLPGFESTNVCVQRRFNDFEILHRRLSLQHPGVVVPPLPEKSVFGRFGKTFNDRRMEGLERFLVRVCNHPSLRVAPDLRVFLQSDALAWRERGKTQSSTSLLGVLKEVQKTIDTTMDTIAHGKDGTSLHPEVKEQLKELRKHLTQTQNALEKLWLSHQDMSSCMGSMSTAVMELAREEDNELSEPFLALGLQARDVALEESKLADGLREGFRVCIKEYLSFVDSIKAVLKERESVAKQLRTAQNQLESKKRSEEEYDQANPTRTLSSADPASVTLTATITRLTHELQAMDRRISDDLKRFNQNKAVDFLKTIHQFVQQRYDYAMEAAKQFELILDQIDPPKQLI
eukprot:TRINITY_DN4792_c0_g1::TRINITY_DN4792_c0_g1_i1::g.21335::m.21335 TRINITY_DN4792_c0_g1::TRINITY_DN4792_c0_g1_i1::g.21335  ORF type:complete len:401 (-),score=42.19,sp/Q9FG38/SNX1_ARATH/26.57/2e-32,Vps5/PF09325.5/1.1e-22,PX/PF00787.19/7.8e-22,Sigma70_ner/PF04546.8/0.15,Sigma70_ner/PF04546.8/88,MCPsignal/PF00015.16/0.36,MCPsignal/PF00015.16/3.6e+02,MCPsignal/PF00015.16/2.6e+02,Cauli_AT/PF03233.8/0.26,Cauli_AT/PF03233.8/6.5e+02,Syntaxin-6_N/PF09177.6/0.41,Syntaxin-6_N/PF09177.6/97,DUF4463/PF14703.1/1